MRDKKGNIIDDLFIDKAWDEMKFMLDKELPVRKRKRGPFIWWFVIALFFGLAAFATYNWASGNGVKEGNLGKENVKTKTVHNLLNQSETSDDCLIAGNNEEKDQVGQTPNRLINNIEPSPILKKENDPTQLRVDNIKFGLLEEIGGRNFRLTWSKDIQLPIHWNQSFIQSLKISPELDCSKSLPIQPIASSIGKTSVTWGVALSGILDISGSSYGYGFRVLGTYPVINQKFEILFGLGYNRLFTEEYFNLATNSSSFDSIANVPSVEFGNISLGQSLDDLLGGAIVNAAERENGSSLIRFRRDQIEIPIYLSYKFDNRLEVFGGSRFAYTLNTVASGMLDGNILTAYQRVGSNKSNFNDENLNSNPYIRSIQINPAIGINYRTNTKLDIALSYNHSLLNTFKTLDSDLFQERAINLSLRYWLRD